MMSFTSRDNDRRVVVQHLNPLLERLDSREGGVCIYGAGRNTARFLHTVSQTPNLKKICCIVDQDVQKQGATLSGIPIFHPEELKKYDKTTAIIVTPTLNILTITKRLKEYGFSNIFYFDELASCVMEAVDMMDAGSVLHKSELDQLLIDCQEKIDFVISRLSDTKSKSIFNACISSRFHQSHQALIDCYYESQPDPFNVLSDQYFPADGLIMINSHEVFVDCGAYDGETVMDFVKRAKGCDYIYAFEPDPLCYELTALQCKNLENYELYNIGIWDSEGDFVFERRLEGASGIAGEQPYTTESTYVGEKTIKVDTLDNVLYDKKHRPTYIKMDIEGAELNALKGAYRIICRDHPKLAICVYHKPEDIWEIPYHVLKEHPDYQIYLRQHGLLYETVMYAVR